MHPKTLSFLYTVSFFANIVGLLSVIGAIPLSMGYGLALLALGIGMTALLLSPRLSLAYVTGVRKAGKRFCGASRPVKAIIIVLAITLLVALSGVAQAANTHSVPATPGTNITGDAWSTGPLPGLADMYITSSRIEEAIARMASGIAALSGQGINIQDVIKQQAAQNAQALEGLRRSMLSASESNILINGCLRGNASFAGINGAGRADQIKQVLATMDLMAGDGPRATVEERREIIASPANINALRGVHLFPTDRVWTQEQLQAFSGNLGTGVEPVLPGWRTMIFPSWKISKPQELSGAAKDIYNVEEAKNRGIYSLYQEPLNAYAADRAPVIPAKAVYDLVAANGNLRSPHYTKVTYDEASGSYTSQDVVIGENEQISKALYVKMMVNLYNSADYIAKLDTLDVAGALKELIMVQSHNLAMQADIREMLLVNNMLLSVSNADLSLRRQIDESNRAVSAAERR